MKFDQILGMIDLATYENLKRAVELGKWADGVPLTERQKALSLQAIIAYDSQRYPVEERVGYVHDTRQAHCGPDPDPEPARKIDGEVLKWRDM